MTGPIGFCSTYGIEDEATGVALRRAAVVALDEALMDVAAYARAPTGWPDLATVRHLPARYLDRYDLDVLKLWVVAMVAVGLKLAQGQYLRPSCVAEQLAIRAVMSAAREHAVDRGEPEPAVEAMWAGIGDPAFVALFEDGDGVPDGMAFDRWFAGFGEFTHGALHPACDCWVASHEKG
jgi:hypothetical protein